MFLKNALLAGARVTFAPDDASGGGAPAAAPAAAPETGGLSIEQATQALMGEPTYEVLDDGDDDAPAAPAQDPAEAGDQPAEEGAEEAAPVEEEAGAEKEGEEKPAEPVEALEAPAYWSKDAKARFAELSPEMQAVVLAQEGPREEITAKVKADAKAAIEQAEATQQGVRQLAEQLNTALPQWIETFQQRWGEPDWEATIDQYGPAEAAKLRARYDRERAQIEQAVQARNTAQREAQQAYVQTEWKALAQLDPVLAPDVSDPKKGAEERQKVTKYLVDAGIGRDAVAQISALEMTMARKAMLWDEAQAASKAAKAKPAPSTATPAGQKPAQRPAARGGAAQPGSPAQRSAASVQNSFNAKPSIDNAVQLLMAMGQR